MIEVVDTATRNALLRALPSVDAMLRRQALADLSQSVGRDAVVAAIRAQLSAERHAILTNHHTVDPDQIEAAIVAAVMAVHAPTLVPVINATGIIVHTNLGRAPLSAAAVEAVAAVGGGYATLEYDIDSGRRGSRSIHAASLLQRCTDAEAATIANNAAAAVLLMLTALCQGHEVLISRGQLVEIGGGFRVPDVMAQSGARLVEVGTTNRTHLRDYEQAITDETAAILVAHHSNFKIIGFTTEPTLPELAELAARHGILLLFDQGSGALHDTGAYGLDREPLVQESIAAGCDVVAFSGDKLLGGPQAGVLCGNADSIERIKRHPLARAVRPDKLCLAGLTATLDAYARGTSLTEIPVWRMITRSAESLSTTADKWVAQLRDADVQADRIDGESKIGGGSLPGQTLPTSLVALRDYSAETVAAALRRSGVIGRIQNDTVVLDPRTVLPGQEARLLDSVIAATAA